MPQVFLIVSQSDYLILVVDIKFKCLLTNSAYPDKLTFSEAN